MLYFRSQNDKIIFFPTGRMYSKKQTRVKENQHIFKSGLIYLFFYKQLVYKQPALGWQIAQCSTLFH